MKKTLKLIALALLTLTLCLALFSCGAPNKDPDKAKAALEAENYRITDMTYMYKADKDFENIECAFEARGGAGMAIKDLTICYFKTAADANKAWGNIQDTIDNHEAASWSPSTFVSGKSGNIIWYGNKELVKIAK